MMEVMDNTSDTDSLLTSISISMVSNDRSSEGSLSSTTTPTTMRNIAASTMRESVDVKSYNTTQSCDIIIDITVPSFYIEETYRDTTCFFEVCTALHNAAGSSTSTTSPITVVNSPTTTTAEYNENDLRPTTTTEEEDDDKDTTSSSSSTTTTTATPGVRLRTVKKRYSNFKRLDSELRKLFGITLPVSLPTKQWKYLVDHMDATFCERRRLLLQGYLQGLLKLNGVFTETNVLSEFLGI